MTRIDGAGGSPVGEYVLAVVRLEVADGLELAGVLTVPPRPRGVVALAHASGRSHLHPRNVAVMAALSLAGFAALSFDLLTIPEAAHERNLFEIPLLASRLAGAIGWLRREPTTAELAVGYLVAGSGAAAALRAAAELGPDVGAIVTQGGWGDLAASRLAEITTPTLLIVGGEDRQALEYARRVQPRLRCTQRAGGRSERHTFLRRARHARPGNRSRAHVVRDVPPAIHRGSSRLVTTACLPST